MKHTVWKSLKTQPASSFLARRPCVYGCLLRQACSIGQGSLYSYADSIRLRSHHGRSQLSVLDSRPTWSGTVRSLSAPRRQGSLVRIVLCCPDKDDTQVSAVSIVSWCCLILWFRLGQFVAPQQLLHLDYSITLACHTLLSQRARYMYLMSCYLLACELISPAPKYTAIRGKSHEQLLRHSKRKGPVLLSQKQGEYKPSVCKTKVLDHFVRFKLLRSQYRRCTNKSG